jgi:hypothetical protein
MNTWPEINGGGVVLHYQLYGTLSKPASALIEEKRIAGEGRG